MRAILEAAVRPEGRLRLGTALADMSRTIGLTNADVEGLQRGRGARRAEPIPSSDPSRHQRRARGDEARTTSTGRDWLDAQAAETLFLSSITIAELSFGIGALPDGRRKEKLAAALDGVLDLFADRILPFDTSAARRYPDLAVEARATGKGFPTPDGYIAAIAAAHGFTVASRDTSAFDAAGLTVIDPWALDG